MLQKGRPDCREQESRAVLDRLDRDSETLGSSAAARAAGWRSRLSDHFGAQDAVRDAAGGATDPIELWGRRIGRFLSLIGVVVLGLWLAFQLRWL
jgi:hypothetical protein